MKPPKLLFLKVVTVFVGPPTGSGEVRWQSHLDSLARYALATLVYLRFSH